MIRKGVPVETIAKWQGHVDNGVLIRKVYSWVFDEGQADYEKAQLAKLMEPDLTGKREPKEDAVTKG